MGAGLKLFFTVINLGYLKNYGFQMTLQIMLLRETFGYKKVLMLVGLKPQMRRLAPWY